MSAPITLFLIDDHPLLRRGLVALLSQHPDLRVVGEAGDAGEALRLLPCARKSSCSTTTCPACAASTPSPACAKPRPAAAW